MNRHLRPEEFADAVEGALTASCAAHLERCPSCAREAADLAALMQDVTEAGTVPEPSPLFWDHLSRRVHESAQRRVPAPAAPAWQRFFVFGAAAAAVVMAVLLMRPAPEADRVDTTVESTAATAEWLPVLEDGPWQFVMDMAGELEWDEARQVAAPRSGTTDAVIAELTPAEREELVRLLQREIGDLE